MGVGGGSGGSGSGSGFPPSVCGDATAPDSRRRFSAVADRRRGRSEDTFGNGDLGQGEGGPDVAEVGDVSQGAQEPPVSEAESVNLLQTLQTEVTDVEQLKQLMQPEFAERASIALDAADARGILRSMGVSIPGSIGSYD